MKISKNKNIRKAVLWLLRKFNPGNIKIKHPFTGDKFLLDVYMHKGYWFKGKSVEKRTMELFRLLISEGDIVVEIGGHIGFMTVYFSHLTGNNGSVYVFEPASNNLPFLKTNISLQKKHNIVLIEKAISDTEGVAVFYMEKITGQNNSLIQDHLGPYSHKNLKDESLKFIQHVETITLDNFISEKKINQINFVKIDIEGAELMALNGMKNMLNKFKPRIMLEVSRDQEEIFHCLTTLGYVIFDTEKNQLNKIEYQNIFGVHRSDVMLHKLNLQNLPN